MWIMYSASSQNTMGPDKLQKLHTRPGNSLNPNVNKSDPWLPIPSPTGGPKGSTTHITTERMSVYALLLEIVRHFV